MSSNNLRILVIGVGSIGERHLRCFQATGRCDVAFCETMDKRRTQVAGLYGVVGHASLEEALDLPRWDAAVIATPANTHIPIAMSLAGRGLHLLIEKPLSVGIEGVEQFNALVTAKGIQVAIGYTLRSMPPLRDLRAAILSERFGKPLQLTVVSGQHFPLYRPAYQAIYYADRARGGGAIQDCVTHHLNAAEWLVGPVDRLAADAAHLALAGVDVEDTVNILTRHGDVLGSFSVNQHQPPNETTFTVICQRGAARWETAANRWLSCSEPGANWTVEKTYQAERDDYYINQAHSFLNQIGGEGEPVCSLAEGIQTLKVNLATLKSVDSRGWETIA